MIRHVIWDLDGTLADNSHRTHLAKSKDWDAYHEACGEDGPLEGALSLLRLMLDNEGASHTWEVLIVTGRSESVRERTVEWLNHYLGLGWFFSEDNLVMRPEGDFTPNVAFKRSFIESLGARPSEVLLIDDHPDAMDLSDVCRVLPVRSDW